MSVFKYEVADLGLKITCVEFKNLCVSPTVIPSRELLFWYKFWWTRLAICDFTLENLTFPVIMTWQSTVIYSFGALFCVSQWHGCPSSVSGRRLSFWIQRKGTFWEILHPMNAFYFYFFDTWYWAHNHMLITFAYNFWCSQLKSQMLHTT